MMMKWMKGSNQLVDVCQLYAIPFSFVIIFFCLFIVVDKKGRFFGLIDIINLLNMKNFIVMMACRQQQQNNKIHQNSTKCYKKSIL